MAGDLVLPEKSPFYRDETPQHASARLRAIYDTSKSTESAKQQADELGKAVRQLADKPARKKMCIGAALLEPSAQPIFAGVNAENVVSVGSIAKLSLLYAACQLRADVGVIATSEGVADSEDRAKRIVDLADAVQAAFKQAKDPGLRAIGSASVNMPRLARIFDLETFLQTPSKDRVGQLLDFANGYATVRNPEPDDLPFDSRLRAAVAASDNTAALSCLCDVGLPYIQALLKRTGLASLHGGKPGLWLAWFYGNPSALRRRPIAGLDARYYSKITTGASADKFIVTEPPTGDATAPKERSEQSGHVATALGLAVLLSLLYRDELFGERDSESMMSYLSRGKWLAGGFRGLGDGGVLSKVGIVKPIYSDCALVESTALRKPTDEGSTGAASAQAPARPLPRTTWIAVALRAQGHPTNDFDDNGVLKELGTDLEAAVASVVPPA
jgi:Beta-lactamase enzyme family